MNKIHNPFNADKRIVHKELVRGSQSANDEFYIMKAFPLLKQALRDHFNLFVYGYFLRLIPHNIWRHFNQVLSQEPFSIIFFWKVILLKSYFTLCQKILITSWKYFLLPKIVSSQHDAIKERKFVQYLHRNTWGKMWKTPQFPIAKLSLRFYQSISLSHSLSLSLSLD